MHYLIDGHNLIGRMPDIALEDVQDEVELVLRLRSWAAGARSRRVTVIFDRGLPGGVDRTLSTGDVKVVFAAQGQSADQLLINRIQRASSPGDYTLVSSDLRIVREAQARRMNVIRSETFVSRLVPAEKSSVVKPAPGDGPVLDDDELAMWLSLFDVPDES